jgi:WD40 repeat protein
VSDFWTILICTFFLFKTKNNFNRILTAGGDSQAMIWDLEKKKQELVLVRYHPINETD